MSTIISRLILCGFIVLQATPTIAVERIDLSGMDLDCVINPSKVANLGVRTPGIIEKILIKRSQIVGQGQLLASLDNQVEMSALDVAKARYAATKTEMKLRYAHISLAKRQYARSLDAFRGDALSKHDLDVSETELELSRIQYAQAKASQVINQKELARAQVMVERKNLIAPFSGVVLERYKNEGELVNEEPVLKIAQLNPLSIEVILSADYLNSLKEGMTAKVWQKEASDQQWTATIVQVDKVIDSASSTFGVKLELDNADYAIPAGMQCQINFESNELTQSTESTAESQADKKL